MTIHFYNGKESRYVQHVVYFNLIPTSMRRIRQKYTDDDIESLRDFSKGETYQYNIKLLEKLGLIEHHPQQPILTTDNGKILGWQLSESGKQLLLLYPEK